MNFPNLPGARLPAAGRRDADEAALDPAEIDRRLASLADAEIVPVRSEWIEATVAEAAAARPAVRRSGPFRRLLAAAVAMLGVHGMLAAATVATVGTGVVVAAVMWTAGRHASETLSYGTALQLLRRSDQPEEDRLAALAQVLDRLRSSITVLIDVGRDPRTPQELAAVAEGYLERLRTQDFAFSSAEPVDPLGVLESARRHDLPIEQRRSSLAVLSDAATRCMSAVHRAEPTGSAFSDARRSVLERMRRMIARRS